ncbi:MAG: PPC domain-containing protein [Acidobacteria bacterium]|nr:PPC domain-containing protein [Acidobacteriota bacterium]
MRRRLWLLASVALVLLAPCALIAASPVLRELEPRGAQTGKAFTLTLIGRGLAEGATVISPLPATFTVLATKETRDPDAELSFLVELSPQAAVGLYPIRVYTTEGLSNILLFSVGAFPEVVEEESTTQMQEYSNDSPDKAQPIPVPATVNATLRGPDQDFYRFQAKAGQRLVFEVEARRAGSGIDPVVRVLDAAGKELARNDDAPGLGVDARVEVAFPKDGDYYVVVHDSKFSSQAQNFYRLKVGSFAFADGMFPLGWKRGEQHEVEMFGGNLPRPVKVRADLSHVDKDASFTTLSVPGPPGSLPFPFVVGDLPETVKPVSEGIHQLPPSTAMNGRISQRDEVDRYRLSVALAEEWLVELQSGALGTSRLTGVVTIYGSKGKKLASSADTGLDPNSAFLVSAAEAGVDASVAFKVPAETDEVTVAVEDLAQRGGPGYAYRLVAKKQPPDFTLTLATPYVNIPLKGSAQVIAVAERRGYNGPIQLSIPNLPDDLVVEGGHIPQEVSAQNTIRASRQGVLTITPKPGAKPRLLDLTVWGEAVAENGEASRRRAQGPGMITIVRGEKQKPFTASWLGLELPAMVAKERPAALEILTPRYVKLIHGMETEVGWKFVPRRPEIRPPKRVVDRNVPNVGNLRVLSGKTKEYDESGEMVMVTTVGTPPMKFDLLAEATINVDGQEETIAAPAVTFEVVQGYKMEAPGKAATLAPGGKTEIAGRLRREQDFNAPITVKADNLPANVSCSTAEVPGGAEEFTLKCEATVAAPAGEYTIELGSSSTLAGRNKENVPYTIPPVEARLIVTAR